jgi:WD40 repeat protein
MTDTTFELELTNLLRELAQDAVRPFDRFGIAERTIASGRASSRTTRWFGFDRRPVALVVVGLLVVALVATVAFIGSRVPVLPFPSRHVYLNELVAGPDMPAAMGRPLLVPLADGRVLTIGSDDRDPTAAFVYDPTTGVFEPTAPMVAPDRWAGSPVRLPDGRVLLIGETGGQSFDPATMRFTALGPTVTPRSGSNASLLPDGRVLIAGGMPPGGNPGIDPALRSAEIFDPRTLTSTPTGSILTPTGGGPMLTLGDGRVLLASDPAPEIYDPAAGTFSTLTAWTGRGGSPLLLPDGRVVLVGPTGMYSGGSITVWDPSTGAVWSTLFTEPLTGSTLLVDGRVLLIGMCQGRPTGWTGVFDPAIRATTAGPMTHACRPASTTLADGRVLIAGGTVGGDPVAVPTVEIFR